MQYVLVCYNKYDPIPNRSIKITKLYMKNLTEIHIVGIICDKNKLYQDLHLNVHN